MNHLACFLLLILLSCGMASALSNDGGGTWEYSRDILIQENSGSTLRDYSILIELDEGNFPAEAQEDGADIRFTDEEDNELSYWIEKFDFSTKKAKIWVKIPYAPASSQTKMQMYYGNPEANPVSTLNVLRYPDVSGSWTGTLYQYNSKKTFLFNLDLSQDGSKVYGISKINEPEPHDEYYAIMEISGSIDDKSLNFIELRSIKEYSPGFYFFLKNVDLTLEGKFPSVLEGYWNYKTYGGTVLLRRNVSKQVANITILEPQTLSVVVTKTISPQSIRQFQESTITLEIENVGRTEITDILINDSEYPPNFDLIGENFHHSQKYDIIEPGETEEINYMIRAKEGGTFSLGPCNVTFADKDHNIQEVKSKPVSLKVIPSITESQPKTQTSQNPVINKIITVAGGVIFIIILLIIIGNRYLNSKESNHDTLSPNVVATEPQNQLISTKVRGSSTKRKTSNSNTPEKNPIIIVNNNNYNTDSPEQNSLVRDLIIAVASGIIVTIIGIIIQKKYFS